MPRIYTVLAAKAIYLEGHSYQDAADRLEMPLGTLKRLQTEGLRELREKMGISRDVDPESAVRRPTQVTSQAEDRDEVRK